MSYSKTGSAPSRHAKQHVKPPSMLMEMGQHESEGHDLFPILPHREKLFLSLHKCLYQTVSSYKRFKFLDRNVLEYIIICM